MRRILSFLESIHILHREFWLTILVESANHGRQLTLALDCNVLLQLLDPVVFLVNKQLRFSIDSVIGVQLFLQLNNGFVSFIEPARKCNHYVSLLQQQLLVPIYLLLVFFNLDSLLFDFLHLLVVFLSNHSLLLFQCISELRSVFNFLATNQHLWVHGEYLLLEQLLLLFFHQEFPGPDFESTNSRVLVELSLLSLLFEPLKLLWVVDLIVPLI